MQYHPENTTARYKTKLPQMIELENDWEVGLVEISCPNDFYNVDENQCFFVLCGDSIESTTLHKINPDYYRSIGDLLDVINNFTTTEGITLTCHNDGRNDTRNRIKLVNESSKVIKFNIDLSIKLGFSPHNQYGTGTHYSRDDFDLNYRETNTIYVYCDVVESVVVGDVKAPLIRVVNVKRSRKGGNMHCVLNPPIYVPLQKKQFDTIEINLMTDIGQPVPFKDGKSFVVLEFRRVHPSFF
jgi:hypothetical protein